MTNLYIPANRKFTFIRIFEDGCYETIDRYTFFELLKATPNPQERVIPDFEAAIVYFVPASAGMAQAAIDLAREVDRQKKRDASRYGCIYSHVIKSIGVPQEYADGTIRISFGRNSSLKDAEMIASAIIKVLAEYSARD